MAQEDEIALDFKIKAADSAKTVADIKKSLKELKNELNNVEAGSDSFKKLSKSINDTEGKLGDLNDSFNTLTGSGVERITNSFGLLQEGFATFDFEKIKTGFKGMGAAMSAVPIFLLVEGIKVLIENFDVVVDVFKNFVGITNDAEVAAKRMAAALDSQADAVKNLSQISQEYTKQELLNAKLRGASDKEQQEISENGFKRRIKYQKDLIEEATNVYNSLLRNDDATREQLEKAGQREIEAKQDLKKLEREYSAFLLQSKVDTNEKLKEENKKHTESVKKNTDEETQKRLEALFAQYQTEKEYNSKRLAEAIKTSEDIRRQQNAILKSQSEELAAKADEDFLATENKRAIRDADYHQLTMGEKLSRLEQQRDLELQNEELTQQQRVAIVEKYQKQEKDIRQSNVNDYLATTQKGLQAATALTDLYFAHQLRQSKGNADRERELKKKQFNVNKAFGIANAVVDGVRSVQQALANTPPPLSYVLAAINGVLAAASIVKIATTKFDDGGSSSGSAGDIGGGVTASAPAIQQPNNTVARISDDGMIEKEKKKIPQQEVVIYEGKMTDTQKRSVNIEETAKIG